MKNLRLADVIHSIDHALLVIVLICFALGGIGTVLQFLKWGFLLEPSGGD